MVRFEYPYEDRTSEPTESETQNFGLADDLLTVRETEDGYVVWDSMQEGIHTEPDGTIGGPYADKAQAQLHKYEFEKKILERSEQDKSHVLLEPEEIQAAPEKEGGVRIGHAKSRRTRRNRDRHIRQLNRAGSVHPIKACSSTKLPYHR